MQLFSAMAFEPPENPAGLRAEIRAFIAANMPDDDPARRANCWAVSDFAFSKALGAAGFIGMVLPTAYGGRGRHPLERYIVIEELLAAGAPVGAHWIADRQTGPVILRYGSEQQKQRYLPAMAAGALYSCIGLSEPGAGSDLAAVRTTARRIDGGWRIDGQKVWTTKAHEASVMLALVRTGEGSSRHEGLSQFLIPMETPGVRVRPIIDLAGIHDFNEVFFDDVRLGEDALLGGEGDGWAQATAELTFERCGPERYLSSHALLAAFIDAAGADAPAHLLDAIGRFAAELWTLRNMSLATAAKLAAGADPTLEAAMVKDLGNSFEQRLPRIIQALCEDVDPYGPALHRLLALLLQIAPSFSLRGGTREIMRNIIARGLGLR